MIHLHWKFIGYKSNLEDGRLEGASEVDVINYISEKEALAAAMKVIERPNFILRQVWECAHCNLENKQIRHMDKVVKMLEKHLK